MVLVKQPPSQVLAERIGALRDRFPSTRQFALAVGVDPATAARWLDGNSFSVLDRISERLEAAGLPSALVEQLSEEERLSYEEQLSEEEQQLLALWRKAPQALRQLVLHALRA